MLTFIDESGYPRPTDSTKNPILLGVCIHENDIKPITNQISSKSSLVAFRSPKNSRSTSSLLLIVCIFLFFGIFYHTLRSQSSFSPSSSPIVNKDFPL